MLRHVLIARSAELDVLVAAMTEGAWGGRTLLVVGELGIGKTSLLEASGHRPRRDR